MRIVCISFGFIEYTIQLANALSKSEDVLLLLPEKLAENQIHLIDPRVTVHLFNMPRIRYPTNLIMNYHIVKHVNKFKPDVVHLQSYHPWFCMGLFFLKKYPLVTTVHDPKSHTGEEKYRTKFAAFVTRKMTDKTIVHGEILKRQMVDLYGIDPSDVYIVPHGDFSIFMKYAKENINEIENSILFFGRIWEYKGLKYLIKAEPLVTEKIPDAKIIIAGRGEDFKKYEQMMAHKDKFEVYNEFIPNEMVAELFQKCSIVVLPYIEATQSGVVPLAYTFKKPVVVTDVGSIPEVVEDGITGLIVPPRNVNELANAIIYLLNNAEKRKNMGKNAYKKMQKDLSWDSIAEKTVDVYLDALASRK